MKIGVNTLFLIPGEVGGSETYLLEILREWKRKKPEAPHPAAEDRAKMARVRQDQTPDPEWVIFTNLENHRKLSKEFSGEGWELILCPFKASNRIVRILREQFELPFKVKKSGVDVLWSPGYTAPFFCSCPQVVSILDMQYKRFPQDLSRPGRWTTEVLVQAAAVRAKKLLTISEFSKQEILKFTRAKAERIQVTPLAADAAFATPVSVEPMVKDPFILCVSNTYPHKNVDQLVRAFVAVENKIPHKLLLVGRPRLGEAAVEKALQSMQDSDRFYRLSGLSREQLICLYQQACLYAFPSLYEGFGLPVLEAMSAGTPVLTTRSGSIPEVGGDFVQYVEENTDAAWEAALLNCLQKDSSGEKPDPEQIQNWIRKFSWRQSAEQTLACLQTVVQS